MWHGHSGPRPAQALYQALKSHFRLNSPIAKRPSRQFTTCSLPKQQSAVDQLLRAFEEPSNTGRRKEEVSRNPTPRPQGQNTYRSYDPLKANSRQQDSSGSRRDQGPPRRNNEPFRGAEFGSRIRSAASGREQRQETDSFARRPSGPPNSFSRQSPSESNRYSAYRSLGESSYDRPRRDSLNRTPPSSSQYPQRSTQPSTPSWSVPPSRPPQQRQDISQHFYRGRSQSFGDPALRRSRREEREHHPELTLDEDIPVRFIRLKNEDRTLAPPQRLHNVLASLDRTTTWVQQLSQPTEEDLDTVVAKLLSKEDYQRGARQRQKEEKERKRESEKSTPKQMELNWTISPNDLNTKIRQTEGVLAKGRRIDLLIKPKPKNKTTKRVSNEEMEKIVKDIRERLVNVGANEWKKSAGKIGEEFVMCWQRKKTEKEKEAEKAAKMEG
ncbi:MAG: hypothetical protein Q9160_003411 [Pyrenula sp. 1 TL-2023]